MTIEDDERCHWPVWRRAALRALRTDVSYGPVAERLRSEPCIVEVNHRSLLDGPIVALASPVPLAFAVNPYHAERNRWTRTGMTWLERRGLGRVISVGCDKPSGLRYLLKALAGGMSVCIFPEGRILHGDIDSVRMPGSAWLAARTGCPLVQVRIDGAGSSRLFAPHGTRLRPPIRVVF